MFVQGLQKDARPQTHVLMPAAAVHAFPGSLQTSPAGVDDLHGGGRLSQSSVPEAADGHGSPRDSRETTYAPPFK